MFYYLIFLRGKCQELCLQIHFWDIIWTWVIICLHFNIPGWHHCTFGVSSGNRRCLWYGKVCLSVPNSRFLYFTVFLYIYLYTYTTSFSLHFKFVSDFHVSLRKHSCVIQFSTVRDVTIESWKAKSNIEHCRWMSLSFN